MDGGGRGIDELRNGVFLLSSLVDRLLFRHSKLFRLIRRVFFERLIFSILRIFIKFLRIQFVTLISFGRISHRRRRQYARGENTSVFKAKRILYFTWITAN